MPGNQDYRSLVNSVKNLFPMQLELMIEGAELEVQGFRR